MGFGNFGHRRGSAGGSNGPSLTANKSTFLAGTATGAILASLSQPFGGGENFTTVGTVPGQLAISAGNIVAGASAAVVGAPYTITIRAAKGGRAVEEPITLTAAIVITAPAAPATFTVTAGNGQNKLEWTDGADGGSPITSHNLYRSTAAGFTPGPANLLGTITSAPPYLDAAPNGTRQYYHIAAVNAAVGEGAWSGEASGLPAGSAAMPQPGTKILTLRVKDMPVVPDGTSCPTWADPVSGITGTASGIAPKYYYNGGDPYLLWDGTTGPYLLGTPATLAAALDAGIYTAMYLLEAVQASTFGPVFCVADGSRIIHAANGARAGVGVDGTNKDLRTHGGLPWTDAGQLLLGVTGDANAPGGHDKCRVYFQGGCVTPQAVQNTTAGGAMAIGGNVANSQRFKGRMKEVHFWSATLGDADHKRGLISMWDARAQAHPWIGAPYYLIGFGSSVISGQNPDSTFQELQHMPRLAARLGLAYGQWSVCSYGGGTVQPGTSLASRIVGDVYPIPGLVGIPVSAIYMEWYNSMNRANILAETVALCAGVRAQGIKLAFDLMTDYTSVHGTDSSPVTRAMYCAYDWVAAGAADVVVPVNTDTQIGVPGSADANPADYYIDGLHLSQVGYDRLASIEQSYVAGMRP